jgi:hypothetical protein
VTWPGALLKVAVGTGCAAAFAVDADTAAWADVAAAALCPVIAAPATAAIAVPAVSNARIFN